MKKIIFILLFIFLVVGSVLASEEGVLSFSSFIYKSKGICESGPVVVAGEKNTQNEIVRLAVEAFGKKYQIPKEKLKSIPKMPYNGVRISYEQGYERLGGKTIYVFFCIGFNSGITEKLLITINESGKIEVEK